MVKHAVKLPGVLLLGLALWPAFAWSQQPAQEAAEKPAARDPRGPSADGLYWYEVEVTIFSSVYGGSRNSEIPVPDNNGLRYLGQLRRLQNQSDCYLFPFATENGAAVLPAADKVSINGNPDIAVPLGEGPVYSPADPNAFKILDQERDPFLALDRRSWRFNQLNSRLESKGEHKVLWHQVWRQPIKPRAQTPALQIEGGNAFGEHHELEGSVRVIGTGNDATIDANLWLSNFSKTRSEQWQLPELPRLAPAEPGTGTDESRGEAWYPDSIWQLNQNRDLGPNALYYLDHPTLGLLVEIRPYLVPETRVPQTKTSTAKPAGKRGFE